MHRTPYYIESPLPAAVWRKIFKTILTESLEKASALQIPQNLREWVRDKVENTREAFLYSKMALFAY